MQKVDRRSCSTNYSNRKTTTNVKSVPSDTNREKREARMCKLDKSGVPMPSLSRKKVLDRNTYARLKNEAVVVSAEERRIAAEIRMLDEERLKNERETRITEQRRYDSTYTTKGPKLAQLDAEASEKTGYVLNRARELRQDQEDEIKQCNSLILSTKCLAIRCAQIAEKELLQKEIKQEERRMEELMTQERMLEAKKYEKAQETERLKKKLQATEIVQQMKENELAREWEAARVSEEAKVQTDAAIEAQRAEVMDYKEKLKKQAVMRKEFSQINAQLKDMKEIDEELEKIEIRQIQEYNKKKNKQEMAYEEELKKQANLKEKEIAKIQASQKALQDMQAAKDELNALRTQDKVEKEWRRKEREEAIKKIKENEELKEARRKQIEDQRESYAYEIQREKEQFDKIIKHNIEDMEKTKEMERLKKEKIDKHRANLKKQIYEKELEKIQERKKFFQEGVTYQEEEAARKKSLRETMQKKIENLKTHNLPTKYVQGLERTLKLKE